MLLTYTVYTDLTADLVEIDFAVFFRKAMSRVDL